MDEATFRMPNATPLMIQLFPKCTWEAVKDARVLGSLHLMRETWVELAWNWSDQPWLFQAYLCSEPADRFLCFFFILSLFQMKKRVGVSLAVIAYYSHVFKNCED